MPDLAPALAEIEAAPSVPVEDVSRCDVCGDEDSDLLAEGYDYELATCSNRWPYVKCRTCGHVWLSPRPAVQALNTIYPSSYYAYNYDNISAIARRGKEMLDSRKIGRIIKAFGQTPRSYLDVGCGDGRYLRALIRRGVAQSEVHGIELDADIVERLRDQGLDAHQERVEESVRFEGAGLDLITMFHVIEHVASPHEVVERLARWLAPGGVLALETPNIDSFDARLFPDGTWGGLHIPRHWHLFHPDTARRLLTDVGLEVEAIRYETGHAFWMYSVHHRLRYGRRPKPRLARWFDPLESLIPLVGFTAFDRIRSTLGARTSAMLLIARKPSET